MAEMFYTLTHGTTLQVHQYFLVFGFGIRLLCGQLSTRLLRFSKLIKEYSENLLLNKII